MRSILLQGLNQAQTQAITDNSNPLIVVAGAGCGKTTVITHKIAWLISQQNVAPQNIAAITFTNKAALEMNERIKKLLPSSQYKSIQISTFHSLGLAIIKSAPEIVNLRSSFSLIDDKDSTQMMTDIIDSKNKEAVKNSINQIKTWQSKNISANDALLQNDVDGTRTAQYYLEYQQRKSKLHLVDFNDLIDLALIILNSKTPAATQWQKKFQYVLVDEYQDTNAAQYHLFNALVDRYRMFMVVGDIDQSIYSWRGAQPENMVEIEKNYAESKKIVLTQNYRSTNSILSSANQLINRDDQQNPKNLWSALGDGDPIKYLACRDEQHEAIIVLESLRNYRFSAGLKWSDFAILYRSNYQSDVFEQQLRQAMIPYTVSGSIGLFDRVEIKDLLAYLQLITNFENDQAFLRIINKPARKIGLKTISKLVDFATSIKTSLFYACTDSRLSTILDHHTLTAVREFALWIRQLAKLSDPLQTLKQLYSDIDYEAYLRTVSVSTKDFEKRNKRVYSFKSWFEMCSKKNPNADLDAVLWKMNLGQMQEEENQDNAVNMMTIHAAKGLEFPYVFLTGVEDGLIPHKNSIKAKTIKEERRLMYVAVTRAKIQLVISYAKSRNSSGKKMLCTPSIFINEMVIKSAKSEAKKETTEQIKAKIKALYSK